jgi:hypothetical protein
VLALPASFKPATTTSYHTNRITRNTLANLWDGFNRTVPRGDIFFVVIGYYSRFPEVQIMKSFTSRCIIQKLMKIFATHGLLSVIKTDNAPNMVSQEITNFFTANEIKQQRFTPYYQQAAGLVGNFNKTIAKKALRLLTMRRKSREQKSSFFC